MKGSEARASREGDQGGGARRPGGGKANPGSPKGSSGAGKGTSGPRPAVPSPRFLWLLLVFMLGVWVLYSLAETPDPRNLSYSTFRTQVEEGNVSSVTIEGHRVQGELRTPISRTVEGRDEPVEVGEFYTHLPSFGDDEVLGLLRAEGVEVEIRPESQFSWWLVLFYAVPFVLILFLLFMFLRGMSGQSQQVFSMGKSRARLYEKGKEATTFDDVAGQEGAKKELQEVVEFLKYPERFSRLGGEIPKGILLVGPPGTGKTLMARAVAGEADAPFFHVTGSDFMEMLVGVGASRVRDLFKEAKEAAPAIIFVDELDSVGRKRGAGLGGGHDEREQTLNQLLSEMDGFEANQGVVVLAATNRPDILDTALLRPGRFDRQVTVDLPTRDAREAILAIHARRKPLAPDVDLGEVARATPGFSGADLRNLLNEAALLAARLSKDQIEKQDIDVARDKILMGLEREGLVLTEEERRLIAYHEGGHAVVAIKVPNSDPVHKVTIIPRGRAMGVTQQMPERDRYIHDRRYLEDRLAVLMGGRAAEELVLDTETSGAEDDLRQATHLARRMVTSWGMSNRFGRLATAGSRDEVFLGQELGHRREYSDATSREVDEEVRAILDQAFDRATEILRENRDGLDRLANALLEEEDVGGERVLELLDGKAPPAGGADESGPDEPGADGSEDPSAPADAKEAQESPA
jgi:cell division protease FtsH